MGQVISLCSSEENEVILARTYNYFQYYNFEYISIGLLDYYYGIVIIVRIRIILKHHMIMSNGRKLSTDETLLVGENFLIFLFYPIYQKYFS